MIDIIKGTRSLEENSVHVAYLDKNHPPNGGIENATNLIDEQMPAGVDYVKVYLVPQIQQATVPGYPLSYECIGQCLYNGTKRENHETLDNKDVPGLFAIQLMFLAMNHNCTYDQGLLERQGLSAYLRLPLTNQ